MSRRKAFLAALALCGGVAVSAAPLSTAASIPPPPQPCGTHLLLTQYEGNYYLWLPNPTGDPCWITVEIPGSIQKPGSAEPPIDGCPAEPLAYENDGHDYVLTPDPSGQQTCGHYTELPVTVPPTL